MNSLPENQPAARRQQVVVACLLALFAALSLWWVLYQPRRDDLLFSLMPDHSLAVSAHWSLADRWQEDLSHPLVEALAVSLDAGNPASLAEDAGTRALVRWLSGPLTVASWTGAGGNWDHRRDSIHAASWVGGPRAAVFRLLLALRWVPGLGRARVTPEGTRYFILPAADPSSGAGEVLRALSLRVYRGMVLASWSPMPEAVEKLHRRLVYRAQVPRVTGGAIAGLLRDREEFAHAVWFDPVRLGLNLPGPLGVYLSHLSSERISLDLVGLLPGSLGQPQDLADGYPPPAPGFPPPDAPVLSVVASSVTAGLALDRFLPGILPGPLPANGRVMAWLTGPPYEGRILGIRSPALFVAAPVGPPNDFSPVGPVLDQLNARWNLGLTPRDVDVEGEHPPAMLIDTSRLGFGRVLPGGGHLAIVTGEDGWLVAGSSARSWRRQTDVPPGKDAGWRSWLWPDASAGDLPPVRFWADPGGLADEARHLAALYRLAGMISGEAPPERVAGFIQNQLPVVLDLLHVIGSFGPLHGELRQGRGGRMVAGLHIGRAPEKYASARLDKKESP